MRRWSEEFRKALSEDRDLLKTIVEETLQQVLEGEMEEALQAGKSERTETRLGYRAGYYNRTLVTRVGKVELRVPQDRQGRFRTEVFERYQRSEKALVAAMLEMYVQGVSTRKVKAITEELCGHEFSSATISRIVGQLDAELEKFAKRRLEEPYPYLVLDARYEKVREDGAVRSQAVAGSYRDQLGRQVQRARRRVGESGEPLQLARLADRLARAFATRGRVCGQRRPCGSSKSDSRNAARSGLAALLCSFPAERFGLSAAQGR